MRRRDLLALFAATCFLLPLSVRAQIRHMGVLLNLSEEDVEAQRLVTVFREELTRLGWADDRNFRVDYRWTAGDVDRARAFAKELVQLSPDIIVGYGTPSIVALHRETHSIPIVFLLVTDPVGQGIVASLAHPGSNVTGFQDFEISLGTKWMEVLTQIAPSIKRVTVIFNPKTAPYYPLYLSATEEAALSFAVKLIAVEVHDDAEIERAVSDAGREPNGGLFVLPDTFNRIHRQTTIALADRYRLPAVYFSPLFAREGGLISYGPDEIDMVRRAATYVDRILKGSKVADLPVQQPIKFQLVINLKTAKALGLTVPQPLLARADEVIE